jgi:hypothetical protein
MTLKKTEVAEGEDIMGANGLAAADVKAYIDPQVVNRARRDSKKGRGLPAASLEELQQGLAKLQAEGVLEGLKATKDQQAQSDSQRKTDAKAALAALEGVLSANGLTPADVKAYIDPQVVGHARSYAKQGLGLPAASLEELQEGLAKLQAEGVAEGLAEGLKAAKVQHAGPQRKTDTKAAVAALAGLMGANGLAPADAKAYIASELVHDARTYAKRGSGLPAAKLEELQQGLAKLQAQGVAEGLSAA